MYSNEKLTVKKKYVKIKILNESTNTRLMQTAVEELEKSRGSRLEHMVSGSSKTEFFERFLVRRTGLYSIEILTILKEMIMKI